jgi:NAD(P)-dependent dehydrogenase (short-subunit alcohol dehydrogenase family)
VAVVAEPAPANGSADGRGTANGNGNGSAPGNALVSTAASTAAAALRVSKGGEPKPISAGNIGTISGTAPIPPYCYRYTIGVTGLPALDPAARPTGPVTVTGDNPVAEALAAELFAAGVPVGRARSGEAPLAGGVVVVTDLLDTARPTVVDVFPALQRLLVEGTADVVFVSALGGGMGIEPAAPRTFEDPVPQGAGVRALVKTAGIEYPDRVVRLVDLGEAEVGDPAVAARLVAEELAAAGAPAEVGRRDGARLTSEIVRLHGRPPGTDPVDVSSLGIGKESVVLFTGGARGITAQVAVALARHTGCTIELSGRSPLPADEESPELAAAVDRKGIRGVLVQQGLRDFKEIDRETDRILAAREVRATLRALAEAGSEVTYHQVDVRDPDALAAVVGSVYERRGRLDGVVAGAGIMNNVLLAEKTIDVFTDVYATKVDSLRTLLQSIRGELGFLLVFSSAVGHTGNRGQIDYTAANDALDTITRANADRARRVLVVDWGPWDSALGMVYDELGKLMEAVGIGLISPAEGTGCVLGDLAHTEANQLMIIRAEPQLIGARDDGPGGAVVAGSANGAVVAAVAQGAGPA